MEIWAVKLWFLLISGNMLKSLAMARGECTMKKKIKKKKRDELQHRPYCSCFDWLLLAMIEKASKTHWKSMVYVYEKCYGDRELVWFKYFPWSSISKLNPTVKSLFSDFFSYKILKKRLNQTSFLCRTSINIVFWGKLSLHWLKYLLEKLKQGCQWTLKTLKGLGSEKGTLKTFKIVLGTLKFFFVCQKKYFCLHMFCTIYNAFVSLCMIILNHQSSAYCV